MSKSDFGRQMRLNVISKQDVSLRISIIVGHSLTISHLKRKIQTQFSQLYGIELVVRVIENDKGFIISNNSNVEEHFSTGDTIYFSQHQQKDKTSDFNMNLPSNIGQILSTIRFMTGSALQKLDKIDLTSTNSLQIVTQLLHIGLWYTNPSIVKRLFRIYNKVFGENSIQKFISEGSEIHIGLLLRNFSFWLVEIPSSYAENKQIIWQLLQLIQKFSCNKNFAQMIKNNKITRTLLEISKNQVIAPEVKKLALRTIKNINGGGKSKQNTNYLKTKSDYIPSILGNSEVGAHDTQQILAFLSSSSQNDKCQALQMMHESNFQSVTECTVRSEYFYKLMNLFTIRKFKSRKHITIFNQVLTNILNNTSKQKYIEVMQKDLLTIIHRFLTQGPIELHNLTIQFAGKACKISTAAGMFNLEKAFEVIDSPYLQFQKHIIFSIGLASEKLNSISPIRFIPGIRDFIKISLKTKNEQITYEMLKVLGNLTLDEQCQYQIINLKGIQVFVKMLETSMNPDINRTCSKSLLNIAISSRENKAKVLSLMNNILQIFYQGKYDPVTFGYIETILKSKNI